MRKAHGCAQAAVFLPLACLLAPHPLSAHHRDNETDLRRRIEQEKNPVKKAKDQIRLANLMMDQAVVAYDAKQLGQGQKFLEAYTKIMGESWTTLQASGRNAARNPQGFKELEIALRLGARTLRDLRHRVSYFNRGPIDRTSRELTGVHAAVLDALFPGAVPPKTTAPEGMENFLSDFLSGFSTEGSALQAGR